MYCSMGVSRALHATVHTHAHHVVTFAQYDVQGLRLGVKSVNLSVNTKIARSENLGIDQSDVNFKCH